MLDHTTYWANKDLVMPRIARAINNGIDYPWPEADITKERRAHRARTAARFELFFRLAAGLVIVAGVVLLVLKIAGVF